MPTQLLCAFGNSSDWYWDSPRMRYYITQWKCQFRIEACLAESKKIAEPCWFSKIRHPGQLNWDPPHWVWQPNLNLRNIFRHIYLWFQWGLGIASLGAHRIGLSGSIFLRLGGCFRERSRLLHSKCGASTSNHLVPSSHKIPNGIFPFTTMVP